MVAYIVDMILYNLVLVTVILILVFLNVIAPYNGTEDKGLLAGSSLFVFYIFYFVMQWCYFAIQEGVTNGKTVGKMLVGVRVVNRDGRALDVRSVILRNFVRVFDQDITFYLGALFCMIFNREYRRIGDLVAGTVVVVENKVNFKIPDFEMKDLSSGIEEKLIIRKLGEGDLYVLRTFLNGSGGMPEGKRREYALKLAVAMKKKLDDPEEIRDPVEYLQRIYISHEDK